MHAFKSSILISVSPADVDASQKPMYLTETTSPRSGRPVGVRLRHNAPIASYTVNNRAAEKARRLIESRQYVLNSDWGDVQPNAEAANAYLESHSGTNTATGISA